MSNSSRYTTVDGSVSSGLLYHADEFYLEPNASGIAIWILLLQKSSIFNTSSIVLGICY